MTTLTPVAWSQPRDGGDSVDKVKARKLLETGDEHLNRGDRLRKRNREQAAIDQYEQALAAYEKAHAAYPVPQIYFPIATAQEKLGHFADALQSYRRVLAHKGDISDALRAQVEIRVQRVKEHVVELVLDVAPEGAAVIVDGTQVGTAPLPTPLFLAAGEHTVKVTADDHIEKQVTLTLEAGQRVEKAIALAERPQTVATPLPPPTKPAPQPSKLPLILGVSATGAFVVAAGITGGLALGRHGTYNDTTLPADDREAARDSGKTLAITTDVLAGAAVATGIVTAWYYFTVYRPEAEAAEGNLVAGGEGRGAERVMVTPYASAGGGGIAAFGRF